MSIPSVLLADANWYGSLRGGVEFGGGETNFYDGASRWGIKGSNEVSEGLTAVYRFEHKMSTTDAGQSGGRLSYVGLSGGFGNLTLGQIWSASYNHAGVIRDFPYWNTSPDTSVRVGNALSYSLSTGAVSLQMDAIMDGSRDTGKAIDQFELGLTVGLGDIGKIAFSHVNSKDTMTMKTMPGEVGSPYVPPTADMPTMYMLDHDNSADSPSIKVMPADVMVYVKDNAGDDVAAATNFIDGEGDPLNDASDVAATTNFVNNIMKDNNGYYVRARCTPPATDAEDDACEATTIRVYVQTTSTTSSDDGANTDAMRNISTVTTETYHLLLQDDNLVIMYDDDTSDPGEAGMATTLPKEVDHMAYGYKGNHISAEFGLGDITTALGYSQIESNDPAKSEKKKIAFLGFKGSLGDTGMSWGAYSRKKTLHNGSEVKPWTIGVSKALGDGASTYVEHHNDGEDGSTVVALRVDF